MLAPLLKLMPWHNPPTLEEQEEINELIHELDQAQEELDQSAQDVKRVQQQYATALHRMSAAAERRVQVGKELRRTRTGARIWKRWTKTHRWGCHYDDDVFQIIG